MSRRNQTSSLSNESRRLPAGMAMKRDGRTGKGLPSERLRGVRPEGLHQGVRELLRSDASVIRHLIALPAQRITRLVRSPAPALLPCLIPVIRSTIPFHVVQHSANSDGMPVAEIVRLFDRLGWRHKQWTDSTAFATAAHECAPSPPETRGVILAILLRRFGRRNTFARSCHEDAIPSSG
jgi:hypothetical protein